MNEKKAIYFKEEPRFRLVIKTRDTEIVRTCNNRVSLESL